MNRYTSTARKDGRWWVVQCDQEPGALSQVVRLDQAAEHQREAIAFVTGLAQDEIEVAVVPVIDDEARRLLDQAHQDRAQAEELAEQASREIQQAARLMVQKGLSLRDVGSVLGVSHQRAHQLVNAAG